ncbi:hypothetical protein AGLY_013241 [Aphis glycines]|uniref:Uncharacterized protein n=1 Tax=Aphis glycines TaxID=307491 RepID=A0A6G0T6L4_APHGL|nr:hypothetical protein AGLY_013241 [Aphis glycines]
MTNLIFVVSFSQSLSIFGGEDDDESMLHTVLGTMFFVLELDLDGVIVAATSGNISCSKAVKPFHSLEDPYDFSVCSCIAISKKYLSNVLYLLVKCKVFHELYPLHQPNELYHNQTKAVQDTRSTIIKSNLQPMALNLKIYPTSLMLEVYEAVQVHYVVVLVNKMYGQAKFQMQSIVLQKMLCVQKNHHHVLEHVVIETNTSLKYDPKTGLISVIR